MGTHFLEWLNPTGGLNWIDIGCGSGAFTAQVAEFFSPSHLLVIDPSEAQIEFARNRSIKHPVTFQTGDAMSLQCVDNSMDIATMALVLFFVPDPENALAEMKESSNLVVSSQLMSGIFLGEVCHLRRYIVSCRKEKSNINYHRKQKFPKKMNSRGCGMIQI